MGIQWVARLWDTPIEPAFTYKATSYPFPLEGLGKRAEDYIWAGPYGQGSTGTRPAGMAEDGGTGATGRSVPGTPYTDPEQVS